MGQSSTTHKERERERDCNFEKRRHQDMSETIGNKLNVCKWEANLPIFEFTILCAKIAI
jgi:hypothetical protein